MDPITFIVASLTGALVVPKLNAPRRKVRDGLAVAKRPPRKKIYRRAPGVTPRRFAPAKEIIAHHAAGASVAEIAQRFDVTRRTVYRYIKQHAEATA